MFPTRLDDLIIEPNQPVIVPVWSIHRDPEYYDNPEEFRPERWLKSNPNPPQKTAYLAFSVGPRMCIG